MNLTPNKSAMYAKKWRDSNKDKVKEQKTNWLNKPENRVKHILHQAKKRALQNEMEFSITLEDLLPLPTHCPVLEIEINYKGNTGLRGFVNNSPSIDRINSSFGYIKGNVKVICWRANRIKSDATISELSSILNYMKVETKCN